MPRKWEGCLKLQTNACIIEKMYTKTLVAGLSWNFKLGEYYRLIPSYSFKWVDANNKYGDGTAFNYDVHALGVVFSFDY